MRVNAAGLYAAAILVLGGLGVVAANGPAVVTRNQFGLQALAILTTRAPVVTRATLPEPPADPSAHRMRGLLALQAGDP
ncbi:MAG TPA: hypothetical protein VM536_16755, partial [Chloroflexia bacterium]|nr:hypothetical protein [Chloroflexia bacterium]